jgi:hypothetical protein
MLAVTIAMFGLGGAAVVALNGPLAGVGLVVFALAVLATLGFFTLQENEARVLILAGRYRGTTRQVGLLWGNPFFSTPGGLTSPASGRPSARSPATRSPCARAP